VVAVSYDPLFPEPIPTGEIISDVLVADNPIGTNLNVLLADIDGRLLDLESTWRHFDSLQMNALISTPRWHVLVSDAQIIGSVICEFLGRAYITDATTEESSVTADACIISPERLILDERNAVLLTASTTAETVFASLSLSSIDGSVNVDWDIWTSSESSSTCGETTRPGNFLRPETGRWAISTRPRLGSSTKWRGDSSTRRPRPVPTS
jgi:hypothetical protein